MFRDAARATFIKNLRVRDPVRNLPRAILLGLCLARALYLVVALVAILLLCRLRNLPPVTLRSH
jgi:hypothetical protein